MTKPRSLPTALFALLALLASLTIGAAHPPAAAFAAGAGVSCAPDSGSSTITGTVTGNGGALLNGVIVYAYTPYGQRGGYAYTNGSGVYQITGLIAGSYLLQFQPGSGVYAPEWYNNQPSASSATPVAVTEGGTTAGINVQLEDGARFSGQVTGAGGGPLQSVQVSVYDSSGQNVATVYTDASGNYTTAPGLANGNYRIGFSSSSIYLGQYYDNKPALESATLLVVSAPTLRTGVNATLARGGQISGRVTNAATGLPLSSISVSANGNTDSGYAYTDTNGNYTINGLASGSYEISASPLSDSTNLVGTNQTADVTAPDTTSGVNLTLAPGGTITGKVTATNGTPLQDITAFVSNADGSYQNYVSTNASGVYTATALPSGQYEVTFRPSNYLVESYNNKLGYQGDPISVTAPNTVTGIDAVLEQGGAMRGTVTDASTGLPIKDVYVEVLDTKGSRVEGASTKADGSYEIGSVLPTGSYRVRFNADERFASCAYVTEYYNDKLSQAASDLIQVTAPIVTGPINAALSRGSNIFGKMTDAATGSPITNGSIRIYDAQGTLVMFGRIGMFGGYHTQTALPSGSYRIQADDNDGGYIDEFYNNKYSLASADPVTLSAPNDRLGIEFALEKGALVTGHVTNATSGAAFRDGYIVVFDTNGLQVGYGSIAADGSYSVLNGLPTGSYRVAVVPYSSAGQGAGLSTAKAPRPLDINDASQSYGYMTTFYRKTVVPSSATLVQLTAPNSTPGIDISILRGIFIPLGRR